MSEMRMQQALFHGLVNIFQNISLFLLFAVTMMTFASSFFCLSDGEKVRRMTFRSQAVFEPGLSCQALQPECHQSQTDSSSSSSLTDCSSEGQRKINELIADRGNVSDTAAFLSSSSCNHHHFLLSTQPPTLSLQVPLSRSGGHTCHRPSPIFLPLLLSSGENLIIPHVRTTQGFRGFGEFGVTAESAVSLVGVHCVHARVFFTYYRFSYNNHLKEA